MSRSRVTVGPETSLDEAERLFESRDFNILPVVEGGRLIGVLTKTNFLKAFAVRSGALVSRYHEILKREVKTVMTPDPVTADPNSLLTRILEKMVDTRHRAFPVAEGDRLVGIISREDIVRALRHAEEQ